MRCAHIFEVKGRCHLILTNQVILTPISSSGSARSLPTLVDNFEIAEVLECPDLIKEGLVKQDLTTYKQLIARHIDPIVVFLTKSFAFNMQRSILGICTVSKKNICFLYAKSSRQAQHKRRSLVEYPTQLPWQSVKTRLLIYGK
jgi:hypothetical protein